MSKRYYWLKLKEDYFQSPKIKKLRSVAGGDTYALIYLEMQCYSIKNQGIITFEGLCDNLSQELALILNENERDVAFLLAYLEKYKLIECIEDNKYLLPEAANAMGSETANAQRTRKSREKKKQQQLEDNHKVLQCNTSVTNCNNQVTNGNTDIDIELDNKNKDINIDIEKIREYINKNSLDYVNADEFFSYYQQRDWRTNAGVKITNWQALIQSWNKRAKAVCDERQNKIIKSAEKHGYYLADNGTLCSEPLKTDVANAATITDFADLMKSNGKKSNIANFISRLAKEKEVKNNV